MSDLVENPHCFFFSLRGSIIIYSPEGKAGMACIMGFIFDCPQLQASMQMEGGIDFSEMMKEGGIEVMCELFTSGTWSRGYKTLFMLNSAEHEI